MNGACKGGYENIYNFRLKNFVYFNLWLLVTRGWIGGGEKGTEWKPEGCKFKSGNIGSFLYLFFSII